MEVGVNIYYKGTGKEEKKKFDSFLISTFPLDLEKKAITEKTEMRDLIRKFENSRF